MDYSGPERSDLKDVQSINLAFLALLRSAAGEPLRNCLPQKLQPALQALSSRQVERLSRVPFLLMSIGEFDDDCWTRTSRGRPIRDLFTPTQGDTDPVARIVTAAAGFLWQLARKNPYAARVVSGATLAWCEQLAEQTLLRVFEYATDDQRMLAPRMADNSIFWHRLLGAGVSKEFEIRRAAHLSALQSVLTQKASLPSRRLQTAACYSSVPSLELRQAEKHKN
jgi:hypothetical protein